MSQAVTTEIFPRNAGKTNAGKGGWAKILEDGDNFYFFEIFFLYLNLFYDPVPMIEEID